MLKFFRSDRPELKSPREIGLMREAGKLVAEALRICREMCVPGTKTVEIDRAVEAFYAKHKAVPLFKGYKGRVPFPAVTCISINEQVVHGIPGNRVIKDGDLVKFDTACQLNGWCADRAITVMVGEVTAEKRRLVEIGEQTLRTAMLELTRRSRWTEIASAMQRVVESAGFSVVTQYVGHGIGRKMHESPQVPNFVNREVRKQDFKIEVGLVLAIEPMVNMGTPDTNTLRDHWTVVTRDMLPSVHVEHTLAVLADGVYVVTGDEETLIPRDGTATKE